ncbi:hypothetical protein Bca101_101020 [Brassica carinata]
MEAIEETAEEKAFEADCFRGIKYQHEFKKSDMCVQVDVLLRFMSSGLLIDTHGLSTDTRSGAVAWVRYCERKRQARGRGFNCLTQGVSADVIKIVGAYETSAEATETITCWSTVSFVIQYQIGKLGRSLQHLLVLKQEAMFTVSYTKQLKESKKKVQDGYSVMFQTVFSGLLQFEKVSKVLRMSFQELQRFRWSKRGSACGQRCEEDVGNFSIGSPQKAWTTRTSKQSQYRGVCIPRSGKVRRSAKHRFFATVKICVEENFRISSEYLLAVEVVYKGF